MIVVTGGAGFIGSNLVKALNQGGRTDILVIDNLHRGEKFANLADLQIEDYLDKDDFLRRIDTAAVAKPFYGAIEAVFHQGACSVTTEWDGRYMLRNNFDYSKRLLQYCLAHRIAFLYASSAAVYGKNNGFRELPVHENPLNVYAYSKLLFDQHVRAISKKTSGACQIVGLRYFNVYGPRECHKNAMASVVLHLRDQLLNSGRICLFGEYDGYAAGEQCRDFIHVDDIIEVNLWFWQHPGKSGIFNVGTGRARHFNDVARCVLNYYQRGELQYIDFPEHLKARYQSFTEADLETLRATGYTKGFKNLEEGIYSYLAWLDKIDS